MMRNLSLNMLNYKNRGKLRHLSSLGISHMAELSILSCDSSLEELLFDIWVSMHFQFQLQIILKVLFTCIFAPVSL